MTRPSLALAHEFRTNLSVQQFWKGLSMQPLIDFVLSMVAFFMQTIDLKLPLIIIILVILDIIVPMFRRIRGAK